MNPVYSLTLVNLAADAGSVAAQAHVELRNVDGAALEVVLRKFCAIDPIENAAAETEIRVQARHEHYLLRTEQRKLIVYDVNRRELPAQIMTVEAAMRELDGTTATARNLAIMQARAEFGPGVAPGPELPARPPPPEPNRPRIIALTAMAGLQLAAIVWLTTPFANDDAPPGFVPVEAAELGQLEVALIGVYLTGDEPGQHGIVVNGPGELKLFELGTVEAPRVVYAGYRPGRIGPQLCLATDQPGGVIEVTPEGSLVFCGEVYRRIP